MTLHDEFPSVRDDMEITPRAVFTRRHLFMRVATLAGAGLLSPFALSRIASAASEEERHLITRFEDATSYNNFVELGDGKTAPMRRAHLLKTENWQVRVDGLVERPATFTMPDLARLFPGEERVYRFRCVEGWSMVVPWNGFELRRLLEHAGVKPQARFVAFEAVHRPKELPGQRNPLHPWPYREGLRLDEAMHPLTMLVSGMYGRPLPGQNGAPLRLIVPWKYGFKSIKSVVRISLVERQPETFWNTLQPHEYGFYANVNPNVDHPRWSQKTERRLGGGLFARRVPTLMFNGYEDQVAHLYEGMDLTKYY